MAKRRGDLDVATQVSHSEPGNGTRRQHGSRRGNPENLRESTEIMDVDWKNDHGNLRSDYVPSGKEGAKQRVNEWRRKVPVSKEPRQDSSSSESDHGNKRREVNLVFIFHGRVKPWSRPEEERDSEEDARCFRKRMDTDKVVPRRRRDTKYSDHFDKERKRKDDPRDQKKKPDRVQTTERRPTREWIFPDKFDGQSSSWNQFIAKFRICSTYNGWNYRDALTHLQVALRENADHVLRANPSKVWDFGELVETLTKRYGNSGQPRLYQAELMARRRGPTVCLVATSGHTAIDVTGV